MITLITIIYLLTALFAWGDWRIGKASSHADRIIYGYGRFFNVFVFMHVLAMVLFLAWLCIKYLP